MDLQVDVDELEVLGETPNPQEGFVNPHPNRQPSGEETEDNYANCRERRSAREKYVQLKIPDDVQKDAEALHADGCRIALECKLAYTAAPTDMFLSAVAAIMVMLQRMFANVCSVETQSKWLGDANLTVRVAWMFFRAAVTARGHFFPPNVARPLATQWSARAVGEIRNMDRNARDSLLNDISDRTIASWLNGCWLAFWGVEKVPPSPPVAKPATKRSRSAARNQPIKNQPILDQPVRVQ